METIYNLFGDRDGQSSISNKELLRINNILKNINTQLCLNTPIEIPTIIMVGSQSSGKSTLINRMLGMDVIPIGSTMETRTPINIELINNSNFFVEFGHYNDLKWTRTKTIQITDIKNKEEIQKITNEIKIITKVNAGNDMGVSDKEINIKFNSPHVPNLNFIDLPGLTMIACTDRGQPKDIKEQIRKLITKYISNPNNIILCIMPAREDLETDIALELVKQYDINCERTMGILTKVDLMNANNNISNYIIGNISKDLKLKYGYFAIKNHNDEIEYFKNHKHYYKLMSHNRFGIKNLGNTLSDIFIKQIKENIPDIIQNLNKLINENNKQIENIGDILPSNNDAKTLILTKYITDLSNNYLDNLENRYSKLNIGRQIKDIFINFRNEIDSINPFTKNVDNLLLEIIKNCDGNHMSMPLPTIEILEGCLINTNLDCYKDFIPISLNCLTKIKDELYKLLITLLEQEGITKYNKLYEKIIEDVYENLILTKIKNTKQHIIENVNMEKSYIWTDNTVFLNLLKQIPTTFNSTEIDINILKQIIIEYFNSVKEIIKHNIPKVIMYYLVRTIEDELNIYLLNKLQKNNYIQYLVEDQSLIDKRQKYTNISDVLKTTKSTLEGI